MFTSSRAGYSINRTHVLQCTFELIFTAMLSCTHSMHELQAESQHHEKHLHGYSESKILLPVP